MRTVLVIAAVGGLWATQSALAQSSPSSTSPSSATSSGSSTAGGVSTAPSSMSSDRSATLMKVDAKTFTKDMAISDMFEIQSSNLALERTKSNAVKSFAQMMVRDHTKSTESLKAAANKSNLSTDVPTTMDQEHNQMLDKLRKASAADFDRDYIADQVAGHEKAVSLLQSYTQNADNADLKQVAATVLPTVEHHLSDAKKLESSASAAR